MKNMKNRRLLHILLILGMVLALSGAIQTSFASGSESLLDTESIPAQRNTNITVSNHDTTRFVDDEGQYEFFVNTGGGMNAMQMRPDNSSSSGVYTTTSNQSGTFYVFDTGGQGFSDTIILMISVNGTISPDFEIKITSNGQVWDYLGKPTSASDVRFETGISETYTISDFMYNSTWKLANTLQPIFRGQDTTDLSNMFYSMFIDLDVGTYLNTGYARVDYIIKNLDLDSILSFNIYAVKYGAPISPTWISSEFTNNIANTGFIVYRNVIDVNSSMDNVQIQELINNASPDSVVRFAAGNYNGLRLNILSGMEIIADGIVNIIGSGVGTAFNISGNNVKIDGFNIENYENGIIGDGDNIIIENNNINNVQNAIIVDGTNNNINYNNIENANKGIQAIGNGNNILGNNITNTTDYINASSSTNTISGNNINNVNLTIIKHVNATGNSSVGDIIEYTITVTNNGNYNATGIIIADQLDPRLIILSTTDNVRYNKETGKWTIGNLNAGDSVTITIVVRGTEVCEINKIATLEAINEVNSGDIQSNNITLNIVETLNSTENETNKNPNNNPNSNPSDEKESNVVEDKNLDEEYAENTDDPYANDINNENMAVASMKNTGTPLVAILFILLSTIGVSYRKK